MSMLAGATLVASVLFGAGPAQSADAPTEFGTDWHDPVTAAPPIPEPAGKSCQVTLVQAQFKDYLAALSQSSISEAVPATTSPISATTVPAITSPDSRPAASRDST